MKYMCPVCGYTELEESPYDKDGNPSYNICDCCGYEFGFDDDSEEISFEEYRKKWIEKGANWFTAYKKPLNWDLDEQIKKLDNLK